MGIFQPAMFVYRRVSIVDLWNFFSAKRFPHFRQLWEPWNRLLRCCWSPTLVAWWCVKTVVVTHRFFKAPGDFSQTDSLMIWWCLKRSLHKINVLGGWGSSNLFFKDTLNSSSFVEDLFRLELYVFLYFIIFLMTLRFKNSWYDCFCCFLWTSSKLSLRSTTTP